MLSKPKEPPIIIEQPNQHLYDSLQRVINSYEEEKQVLLRYVDSLKQQKQQIKTIYVKKEQHIDTLSAIELADEFKRFLPASN